LLFSRSTTAIVQAVEQAGTTMNRNPATQAAPLTAARATVGRVELSIVAGNWLG